ncbi:zinc/iron-chelating domain-containing protein [Chitinimonas koreensis]|uniref:zinc/iron-chelating domain-containing protein n=1 Tax=Chitinimonas koreensis TaxID=356302 RepID=UPI001FDFAD48|nr:zinc/iron-chelating domain-containing protein [Chitinimonas koreensis]
MARLPEVSAMRRARAERSWSCPYLGKDGCTVYPDRPLICRLFGTTPRLRCPNGCAPEAPVASALEADIEAFMRRVRHVLI